MMNYAQQPVRELQFYYYNIAKYISPKYEGIFKT